MSYTVTLRITVKYKFDLVSFDKQIVLPIPPTVGMWISIDEDGNAYQVQKINVHHDMSVMLSASTTRYEEKLLKLAQSCCQGLYDAGFKNTHAYSSSPPAWSVLN